MGFTQCRKPELSWHPLGIYVPAVHQIDNRAEHFNQSSSNVHSDITENYPWSFPRLTMQLKIGVPWDWIIRWYLTSDHLKRMPWRNHLGTLPSRELMIALDQQVNDISGKLYWRILVRDSGTTGQSPWNSPRVHFHHSWIICTCPQFILCIRIRPQRLDLAYVPC